MNPLPRRKNSLRRPGYDYASSGAYFVTICTYKRVHYFGEITDDQMGLSPLGQIAEAYWTDIPAHYTDVELDAFVVMPNHVHGIVILHGGEKRPVLGDIIGKYKAAVTRNARKIDVGVDLDYPIWQRRFHDRIIRNEDEYHAIATYVANNPALWERDVLNE